MHEGVSNVILVSEADLKLTRLSSSMLLTLGYLLDIFSIEIMVSMVPKGTFFFLFGMFPHSWLGNYIRDNLDLDYKIDVGSMFSTYYTVVILCSLPDRIYRYILGIDPLDISPHRSVNFKCKSHMGKEKSLRWKF